MAAKRASDIKDDTFVALFKGPPGSGKTVGACSWPGPVLVFDFDGRMKPIKKMLPERTDVFYEHFKAGVKGEFARFLQVVNSLEDRSDYVTGVLDSLTSFGRCAVDHSLAERGSVKGVKMNTLGGLPIPEWPEWRFEDRALWQSLSFLRNKCNFKNFIMTAHLQEVERKAKKEGESEDETKTYRRVVTGAQWLASEIPAYFDEVWNFTGSPGGPGGLGKFEAVTVNLGDDSAKTSLNLPKRLDFTAPNRLYDVFQKALRGEIK